MITHKFKNNVADIWSIHGRPTQLASEETINTHTLANESCIVCANTLEYINDKNIECPKEIQFEEDIFL